VLSIHRRVTINGGSIEATGMKGLREITESEGRVGAAEGKIVQ